MTDENRVTIILELERPITPSDLECASCEILEQAEEVR